MSDDGRIVGRIVRDVWGEARAELERDRPRGPRVEPYPEDGEWWPEDDGDLLLITGEAIVV